MSLTYTSTHLSVPANSMRVSIHMISSSTNPSRTDVDYTKEDSPTHLHNANRQQPKHNLINSRTHASLRNLRCHPKMAYPSFPGGRYGKLNPSHTAALYTHNRWNKLPTSAYLPMQFHSPVPDRSVLAVVYRFGQSINISSTTGRVVGFDLVGGLSGPDASASASWLLVGVGLNPSNSIDRFAYLVLWTD